MGGVERVGAGGAVALFWGCPFVPNLNNPPPNNNPRNNNPQQPSPTHNPPTPTQPPPKGVVNTLTELRRAAGALQRVRDLVQGGDPDPSMYGALPPGACVLPAVRCRTMQYGSCCS